MKEIEKEEYFQTLNESKHIIKDNQDLNKFTAKDLQDLKLRIWKMTRKAKEMIRVLSKEKTEVLKELLEKPWLDSNLDLEDRITVLNNITGRLVHWQADKSLFDAVDAKIDEITARNMLSYVKCCYLTKDIGFTINPPITGDDELMGLQLYFIDNYMK